MTEESGEITKRTTPLDRKAAVMLVAAGMEREDVKKVFGVHRGTIERWMAEDREFALDVNLAIKNRASMERGNCLNTLIHIRDNSDKDVARLRAVELIEARAGILTQFDKQTGGPTIVIAPGSEITMSKLTNEDLEKLVRAIQEKMPLEMGKVIDGELVGTGPGQRVPEVAPGREAATAPDALGEPAPGDEAPPPGEPA